MTGIPRVAFSLISVALVLAFWKFPLSLPDAIGDNFEKLGIATYGVYLLHPIVIHWTEKSLRYFGVYEQHLFVLLVLGITIPLALFIFRVFESPMIKLGKRITQAKPQSRLPQKPKKPPSCHNKRAHMRFAETM